MLCSVMSHAVGGVSDGLDMTKCFLSRDIFSRDRERDDRSGSMTCTGLDLESRSRGTRKSRNPTLDLCTPCHMHS